VAGAELFDLPAGLRVEVHVDRSAVIAGHDRPGTVPRQGKCRRRAAKTLHPPRQILATLPRIRRDHVDVASVPGHRRPGIVRGEVGQRQVEATLIGNQVVHGDEQRVAARVRLYPDHDPRQPVRLEPMVEHLVRPHQRALRRPVHPTADLGASVVERGA
jgi:hypothetical protein